VPITLGKLPDDVAELQQMLREVVVDATKQQSELIAENDKLRMLIERLLRREFGRSSEKLSADQLALALEDIEQSIAQNQAAEDPAPEDHAGENAIRPNGADPKPRASRPKRNLGALPTHLPRYEVVIDIDSHDCPCCGGKLHVIDEVRSEQLDHVPAQLRVRVTRRPRYGCRACESAVVVAPAPERPIDGGMPTEALVVQVLVGKYCDSLPLYRQTKIFERQGVNIDRSTLSNWVGQACWWLTPLADLVRSTALSSPKIFADDTTLPVLDPGRGKTKTGRLWCYAVDDRPWKGPAHPIAAYFYSEDRKGIHPATHLKNFKGVLQVDGYAGFNRLACDRVDTSVTLAFCWAHARRKFYDFFVATQSPLAAQALARIQQLYAIEAEIRGQTAEYRKRVRQQRSRPIVEALHTWLQEQVGRISAASDLSKAIGYALRHWTGLLMFLDDGRVEIDNNVVERAIKPVTLNRKNALFAGSDGGAESWATVMTLIETAKLNGVNPQAWLTDVLERIVSGRTKSHELHTLLPWNWSAPEGGELAVAA
jgi:transposase